MVDLSEKKTREGIIDPQLIDAGWKEESLKREVNSIKSDFKLKKYEFNYNPKDEGESRFIDYVLLDSDKSVLAIIEAKRFSENPEKGTIQATTYQKDIENQTKYTVPVFLTNGKDWYIKEKGLPIRNVSGPFSQSDLHRRMILSKGRQKLSDIGISPRIIDRSKNMEIVRQVLDHLEKGNSKALINMATGTGKTRVSMAIIDALIQASYIRNVLFVVDRIALGKQAYDAFGDFLGSEPRTLLNQFKDFDSDKRVYVSTVQTLKEKRKEGGANLQRFSPASLDL